MWLDSWKVKITSLEPPPHHSYSPGMGLEKGQLFSLHSHNFMPINPPLYFLHDFISYI